MSAVPVALFTYNRPEHARRTVEALGKNELAAQTDLIVFSDAPGRINDAEPVRRVREYIDTISGFKSVRIVPRSRNLGLARSVIDGVTQVCGEFGRAIILEDDLVTSSFFLSFMNKALDSYASEDRVGSVHGYWYPTGAPLPNTFFLRIASSWGWATWARAWRLFERDGTRLLTELRDRGLAHDFDLDGAMPYTKKRLLGDPMGRVAFPRREAITLSRQEHDPEHRLRRLGQAQPSVEGLRFAARGSPGGRGVGGARRKRRGTRRADPLLPSAASWLARARRIEDSPDRRSLDGLRAQLH
jgi:hypothetical protein